LRPLVSAKFKSTGLKTRHYNCRAKPGTYNYGGHYNDLYSGQSGGLRVWKSNARVAATREARQIARAASY